eukprot:COSAG01_NODE_21799_length_884_cov_1.370701_1_plen_98_part_00
MREATKTQAASLQREEPEPEPEPEPQESEQDLLSLAQTAACKVALEKELYEAKEILEHERLAHEATRAENKKLQGQVATVLNYLDQVFGPENEGSVG